MWKSFAGAAVAAVTLLTAPTAFAQDWYVRGELGGSVGGKVDVNGAGGGEFDLDNGLVVGVAVGSSLGQGLRTEVELVYLDNDVSIPSSSSDVKVTGLFGNVAYDFDLGTPGVTPYVGAGIGYAKTEHSNPLTRDDDSNFAWQLKGGVGFEISPGVTLDANYRYLNAPDFSGRRIGGGASVEADTDAHVLSVGVRYRLN
jgi:OmpA-OmpF porin, OOP family